MNTQMSNEEILEIKEIERNRAKLLLITELKTYIQNCSDITLSDFCDSLERLEESIKSEYYCNFFGSEEIRLIPS